MAGINGEGSKREKNKKMHGHPVRVPSAGANEQVYVSAVADRVNVGKDEGLRFSGWTELGEDEEGGSEGSSEGEQEDLHCGDGDFVRGRRRKKFRAHRVSARGCARARFRIFMRYITYSGK